MEMRESRTSTVEKPTSLDLETGGDAEGEGFWTQSARKVGINLFISIS
jgi:hypothetical protein